MSKVVTNMKPVYELFIEETEKPAPDVNMLESLIDRLQQEDIDKINELNLGNKKLDKLPNNIGNLINLQKLWIDTNQISEIPYSIGNLTNLQELWIYNNKITEIPDSIGNLANLQQFYCYWNQISEIPKWLVNMNIPNMII